MLSEENLGEIDAGLPNYDRKSLGRFAREIEVYSFSFQACCLSGKEFQRASVNVLQKCKECLRNDREHFRHLLLSM
jgi:hypothetical protein